MGNQCTDTLTLERVADEGIEVTFADVQGYCTPLGMRVPIQACHHPHIVLVLPDGGIALGTEPNVPSIGVALGAPGNFPSYTQVTRRLHQGYLPIVESAWETDGLQLTETALCMLPRDEQVLTGRETQYLVVRLAVTNPGAMRRQVPVYLHIGDMEESHRINYAAYLAPRSRWTGPAREFTLQGSTLYQHDRVVMTWQTPGTATLLPQLEEYTNVLRFDCELAAGETQTIDLVMADDAAFLPTSEQAAMAATTVEDALQWAIVHAARMLAPAMTFITPEARMNDIYRALILSTLQMQVRDTERGWHEPRQWAIGWVWGWEFAHTAVPMMSIGYQHEFAPSLRYFIERQNGVGTHSANSIPQGDVLSAMGSYTGFNGEHQLLWMNETGSILWALAAKYHYSHDAEWLRSVMPSALAAWAWIQGERAQTRIQDEHGENVRYYGLLPAGMPGDIHAKYYQFTFSDNISWYGMQQLALAAQHAGFPEAERLLNEADEYRQCILDVLHREEYVEPETGLLFVPNMVFYRETEEPDPFWHCDGPVQLFDTGLLHPNDERFAAMVAYTKIKYGILLGMAEHESGGTEWYPNQTERSYFRSYLAREEVEKALLVLYSNLVYGMSQDTFQTSERFHTDDENFSAYQPNASGNGRNIDMLRRMVIDEQVPGELWLLRGCPRRWFTAGQSITVANAPTLFGPMALRVNTDADTITIEIDTPEWELPEKITLVLRVPKETAITAVTLDNAPIEMKDECIVLPKRKGRMCVKVCYTAQHEG